MSWREKWQQGEFRGAKFKWRDAEGLVGRKTARHDYPLRDSAYIEDLGLRPREFTLECYVIGKNYIAEKDALIAAIEEPGPGILMHPTMGMMSVAVHGQVRFRESTNEGGMCRFSIPFVLAEESYQPPAKTDTTGKVEGAAKAASAAKEADFAKKFSCAGAAQFVTDNAKSLTNDVCRTLDNLRKQIPTSVETPKFLKDLDKIRNSVTMLVNAPLLLAKSIAGQIYFVRNIALAPVNLINSTIATLEDLAKVARIPDQLYKAYAGLFGYGNDYKPVPRTTPSRVRQAENTAAMTSLVRRSAIIEAARTSTIINFASYNDAVKVRDNLTEAIDRESLSASDEVYGALVDLRAAVIADVNVRGADLARIVSYVPARTEPAFLTAHRLYGDASRAEEIIARNRIAHPLFVPGGVPLEVLSD